MISYAGVELHIRLANGNQKPAALTSFTSRNKKIIPGIRTFENLKICRNPSSSLDVPN
jgi:hypothetical protein